MSNTFLADEKFLEADLLIKETKVSDALALLNEILEDYPDYGKAHNHLGWIYETKLTDYKRADEHYRMAVKFSPEYPSVYYNYAILLSTLQRFDELEQLLAKALAIPGINKGTIHNEYGIMYESQGKYDDAIKHYKEYIKNLFDAKTIETASASIDRCKKKKELLG
jgi:Tfp pilus assembly protein PilF